MQTKQPISPKWDPWDVWQTRMEKGQYELTSIEFTITHLCNLRCQHCAVGEMLLQQEPEPLRTELLIQCLEEIPQLQTLSFTGGEPVLNSKIVNGTLRPLLQYAKSRGLYTQLNSNLTLPLSRYEEWIEDVDVLHISYNYRHAQDFHRMAYHHMDQDVSLKTAEKLYTQMIENAKTLSKAGIFVSAESFLSPFTAKHIQTIHDHIAEMGCRRHEVHPLYPSDFASTMQYLTLDEYRAVVQQLLEIRDPNVWILFGTFPFYPCSDKKDDRDLWTQLFHEPNVTIRQDPDGRNRLNVNIFTGEVFVTDFGDLPPLGNIQKDSLSSVFQKWLQHPLAQRSHCFCPTAKCTGPNLLVADMYYPDWDFTKRQAKLNLMESK